ncbi:F-actin-capping protein subunit alpha [Thecaphora frezii]
MASGQRDKGCRQRRARITRLQRGLPARRGAPLTNSSQKGAIVTLTHIHTPRLASLPSSNSRIHPSALPIRSSATWPSTSLLPFLLRHTPEPVTALRRSAAPRPSAMPLSRLDAAARLLVQAPPGQVSQVYHDLRGILLDAEAAEIDGESIDDAQIKRMALAALEEYNTAQLIPATVQEGLDQVIICQAAQLPGTAGDGQRRYAHPRAKKSFAFDHMARMASDIQPLAIDEEAEPLRAALDTALANYVADRYNSGVSSVFTMSNLPPTASSASGGDTCEGEAAKIEAEGPAPATGAAQGSSQDAEAAAESGSGAELQEAGTATEAEEPATETEATELEGGGGDDAQPIEQDDATEAVPAAAPVSSSADAAPSSAATGTEAEAFPAVEKKIRYVFHHVGNKYHLSNFWSGRWRASYTLDVAESTLSGSLQIQVHYFENGNVQLNTDKSKVVPLPLSHLDLASSAKGDVKKTAEAVVRVVEKLEDDYQKLLDQTYEEMGENAFKALRRALPLTKNKIDWNQITNYRLGKELAKQ